MIPYFVIPPVRLGPLALQPFGVLSAAGILLASKLWVREARLRDLDPEPLEKLATWAVLGGIIGAHLVHLLLYHPEELRDRGLLQLFRVWDGLSSTGGVLGGLAGSVIFLRLRGLAFASYADVFALGVPAGWAVARLGCFSVHDHPGVLTGFALAVAFPGGPRHDLGLYDAVVLAAITAAVFTLDRRGLLRGALLALVALLYGSCRFALDFLRARDLPYSDMRYLGLTPAQYGALLLVAFGAWKLARFRAGPAAQEKRSLK